MRDKENNTGSIKRREIILAGAIAVLLAIGGILAYFTDTEQAVNEFTVGKVEIDLQEPSWDADNPPEAVVSNEEISKDPKVVNIGKNDAYVFIKVSVPYGNVSATDENGNVSPKADRELFTYKVNDGWIEVGSPSKNETEGAVEHVYAYASADKMTAVKSGANTATLFDSVKFINAIDGEGLEETDCNIVVDAYAIQITDAYEGGTEGAVPSSVWPVLSKQSEAK